MSLAAAVEAFENSAKLESSLVWVAATKSWKIGQTAGPTNNRAATARALVTAIRAATPYEIASLLPSLEEALRPPLLDGRPTSASCFAACAEATSALAAKLSLPAVPPRVYSLLFLLIDQAGCAGGAASEIGASAHAAVAAILPYATLHDGALPALVSALGLPSVPSAGRRRLAELLVLALLTCDDVTESLRGRRAKDLALCLCRLLHDGHATTRRSARHALLILMEYYPRAASEPFGRLPLRTQRQLTAVAKQRAAALGPPLLPPPPPPPPHPQAALIQAAGRGSIARRRAARASAFLKELSIGDRLRVVPGGHLGVVRFRGHCGFAPGLWLGIELDQPVGRHDGAYKGERFFECQQRRGVFVRPGSTTPLTHTLATAALPKGRPPPGSPTREEPSPLPRTPQQASSTAPATPRAPLEVASPPPPRTPLPTMLESHRRAINSMKELCDGQLAVLRTHELAAKVKGEGQRKAYLDQMNLLCMQQRMIAMQLFDVVNEQQGAADVE